LDIVIQEALHDGWRDHLTYHPRNWKLCPPALLLDESMRASLRKGWIQFLSCACRPNFQTRRYPPEACSECPDWLLSDPEIAPLMEGAWANALKRHPELGETCNAVYLSRPDVQLSLQAGIQAKENRLNAAKQSRRMRKIIEYLADSPAKYNDNPKHLPRKITYNGVTYPRGTPMRRVNFGGHEPNRERLNSEGCIVIVASAIWYVYVPPEVEKECLIHLIRLKE
jgi:hypothetical protein